MNNSATTRVITKIALDYNGNDKGQAVCAADNNLLSSDPKEQYQEMKAVANRNPKVKKWALTGYISPSKEVGDKLSDKELTEIALEALEKVGVTEKNQYRLDIHNSTRQKHIHFIVNRISTDSKCTVQAHDIGKRFGEAVREVCRKRNLPTDIEIGIQKRQEMLEGLIQSLKSTDNFEDLISEMAKTGYEVLLSSNTNVGISGMRIIREKDKNLQTQRQYKGGYKLSELSNKLKIEEIKEIFRLKMLFKECLRTSKDLEEFRQKLYKAGYYLNLKDQKDSGISEVSETPKIDQTKDITSFMTIYIKPIAGDISNNKQAKNGLFFNKYSGFNYSEIDGSFKIQDFYSLYSHHHNNSNSNQVLDTTVKRMDTTKDAMTMIGEVIEELLKPTYTANNNTSNTPDDGLLKRRRKRR